MGAHLIDGKFQSDKYPTTPRGFFPMKTSDRHLQDLLWEAAQRYREIDPDLADDLETALLNEGYDPTTEKYSNRPDVKAGDPPPAEVLDDLDDEDDEECDSMLTCDVCEREELSDIVDAEWISFGVLSQFEVLVCADCANTRENLDKAFDIFLEMHLLSDPMDEETN